MNCGEWVNILQKWECGEVRVVLSSPHGSTVFISDDRILPCKDVYPVTSLI